jgi:DNA-binding MarR family transcriptional regulator
MDLLKLNNQICFPLYALSRQVTAIYRPLLERIGLTYPQYLVMMLLWETENLTVKEIGEKLMLDTGTLTPLLKRMEQKKLLARTRSTKDERIVQITITSEGLKLKTAAAEIPKQMFCSLEMNPDEAEQFKILITNILKKVNP